MTKTDILKIKKQIDDNQKTKIQVETKLETEYKTAKETYGCSSIKEIDDTLTRKYKELDDVDTQIAEKTKTLDEAYKWDL